MTKLARVAVTRMLDEFDHDIGLATESRFTLLYGPNGVGKTKLLELIRYASKLEARKIAQLPFEVLTLTFSDGTELVVHRDDERHDGDAVQVTRVKFILTRNGTEPCTWTTTPLSAALTPQVRHYLRASSTWKQIGLTTWEDVHDGEVVDEIEMLDRLAPSILQQQGQDNPIPTQLEEFTASWTVEMIATQRLVSSESPSRRMGPRKTTRMISEYSEDLSARLRRALVDNSRKSQELDRSFPKRILETAIDGIGDEEIRDRYRRQSDLRKELASLGLLRAESDVPIPDRELLPWERTVLNTYLVDTDDKLEVFKEVLARVQLLREIVDARFLNKTLVVDAEAGISFARRSAARTLKPEDLSSGEQQELVLMYNLLFKVEPGALVLIDEPEISLHISWQQRFLDDVTRIAALVGLDFLVATHSPQIINKSWEFARQLGPSLESSE